jgi:hypothetical protein
VPALYFDQGLFSSRNFDGMGRDFIDIFSSGGLQCHETLPYVLGLLFVVVEIAARASKQRHPIFHVPTLGYMLSEGISVCIMPIYGFALAFNPDLAKRIAEKNSKVLAVAMFVAFLTLLIHVVKRWLSRRVARAVSFDASASRPLALALYAPC